MQSKVRQRRQGLMGTLQVYTELGLPQDTKLCVFIYGGQPPGEWELRDSNLPEGWVCVVCSGGKPILSDKQLPSNFRLAKPDDFIPDLVRKIDKRYQIAGDCCPTLYSTNHESQMSSCLAYHWLFASVYLLPRQRLSSRVPRLCWSTY